MSKKKLLQIVGIRLPTSLDDLARMADREHGRALSHARRAVEHAVRAGAALIRAQELSGDAGFDDFLSRFEWSERSAQVYMRLALHWNLLKAHAPPEALTSQRQALKALKSILSGNSPAAADGVPAKGGKRRAERTAPTNQPIAAMVAAAAGESQPPAVPLIERARATCALQDAMATLQFVLNEINGIPTPNSYLSFIHGRVREAHARLRKIVAQVVGPAEGAAQVAPSLDSSTGDSSAGSSSTGESDAEQEWR